MPVVPPPPPRLGPRREEEEEEDFSLSPRTLRVLLYALAGELLLATTVILVMLAVGAARPDAATLVSLGVLAPLTVGALLFARRARRLESGG